MREPPTHAQVTATRPAQSSSPNGTGRSAPDAAPTSEELQLAADRWAAMIVEAYLTELRAAVAERQGKPC